MKEQKTELKNFENKIDAKVVNKLAKYLDSKNPKFISKMSEALVALLRGVKTVQASDVEQYVSNYEGLIYKMANIDAASIPLTCITDNEHKLRGLTEYFKNENAEDYKLNCQYIHLFAWAQHFRIYGKTAHLEKERVDTISGGEKKTKELNEEIERSKILLEDVEFFGYQSVCAERLALSQYVEAATKKAQARQ